MANEGRVPRLRQSLWFFSESTRTARDCNTTRDIILRVCNVNIITDCTGITMKQWRI